MSYLIIAAAVMLVISSIFWLRPTARQKELEKLRYTAQVAGLQVRVAKRPDAPADHRHLDSALYFLAWSRTVDRLHPQASRWTLVRNEHRGDASPWEGWRWLGRAAPELLTVAVGNVLEQMPAGAEALEASSLGVGVYWKERPGAGIDPVPGLSAGLQSLRATIETLPILVDNPS